MRYIILIFIIFFSTVKIKAQNEISLLDSIKISVKAQLIREISSSYFSFLDEIRYYDWLYTKKISRVKSTLRTSGTIPHNYMLGLEYKNFGVFFDVSTSEISPFNIEGDYRDENDDLIGELKRNVSNYLISFRYKWKILSLRFGYESNEIFFDAVGTVSPNDRSALLDGQCKLTSIIAGSGVQFKFRRLEMMHNLFISIQGKLNYNFLVADTTLLSQGIVYLYKMKSFDGKVRTLSYIAELKYEFGKVAVILLYRYNFLKSKDIFKETSHRLGVGFMLTF